MSATGPIGAITIDTGRAAASRAAPRASDVPKSPRLDLNQGVKQVAE